MIEKITGLKNKIIFISKQKGDVKKTESEITNAKKIINYFPKINVFEGLTNQINWMKKNLDLKFNI